MSSNLFETTEWKFSVSYDADDNQLSEHRMDAELLASAIKNVAQLVKHADEVLYGENRHIRTYVTAPAKEGSLEVEFIALLIDPAIAQNILSALGFIAPVGAIAGGVFKALREISGKEIIEVHTSDDEKEATVHLSDGTALSLPKDVAALTASPQIRTHIKQIVSAPLYHRNTPVFKIKNEDEAIELKFDDSDIRAIQKVKTKALPPRIDKITTKASFSRVDFDGSKGWKLLLDGNTVVDASISDDIFLKSISANDQAFKKEDTFKIVLEITTYTNDRGKETRKYKILQVLPI